MTTPDQDRTLQLIHESHGDLRVCDAESATIPPGFLQVVAEDHFRCKLTPDGDTFDRQGVPNTTRKGYGWQ